MIDFNLMQVCFSRRRDWWGRTCMFAMTGDVIGLRSPQVECMFAVSGLFTSSGSWSSTACTSESVFVKRNITSVKIFL